MNAPTQKFNAQKGDFASTVRHTLRMVSGKDVSNYTLLFMDPTEKHPAGGHETIFNPSIVLGRGGNCQIKYDDRYKTVSREHACIADNNGKHIIFHNPQAKNPTLVNGVQITDNQTLQNGDEIKLSNDGPRLRYNTSTVKSSTMGLTSRMGMALSQATKPYKRAMIGMFLLLLGALGFGGFNLYKNIALSKSNATTVTTLNTLTQEKNRLQSEIAEVSQKEGRSSEQVDALNQKLKETESKLASVQSQQSLTASELNKLKESPSALGNSGSSGNYTSNGSNNSGGGINNNGNGGSSNSNDVDSAPNLTYLGQEVVFDDLPGDDVYLIAVKRYIVTGLGKPYIRDARNFDDKRLGFISGTGFMTVDGKFITARHVLQPWRYAYEPGEMAYLSAMEGMGGKVEMLFEAFSRSGKNFTFSSNDIQIDDSQDELIKDEFNGVEVYRKVTPIDRNDWAYVEFDNRRGNIKINNALSKSLKSGSKLFPYGFTYTIAMQPKEEGLSPLVSNCIVAQDGLINGVINITGRGFGSGNSGGPVFVNNNGALEAIGIVSAGRGSEIGIIVPVVNLR